MLCQNKTVRYLRTTTLIDESLEEVLYECLRSFILLLATAANQEQTSIVYHQIHQVKVVSDFFQCIDSLPSESIVSRRIRLAI